MGGLNGLGGPVVGDFVDCGPMEIAEAFLGVGLMEESEGANALEDGEFFSVVWGTIANFG